MATDMTPPSPPADRRRPRTALIVVALLAAPLALLVFALATSPPATTRTAESPLVGRSAPEVQAQTLDGEGFDLDDLRGRWVLVNFFATWCVPCRQEHPHLIQFHERHQLIGDATVVGVIYDDDEEAVREFFAKHGGEWPMLLDPRGEVAIRFGVAGVPESFLVAPNGTVAAKVVGGIRFQELEDLLERARGGSR